MEKKNITYKKLKTNLMKNTKTINWDLDIKNNLSKIRKLKEDKDLGDSKLTLYDQQEEEKRFKRYLRDKDAVIDFIDLEVYENLVTWGGTINNVFKFFYRVTPEYKTSNFNFRFLDGFDPKGEQAEESDEYVEKQMRMFEDVKNYFTIFSNYWRENLNMSTQKT